MESDGEEYIVELCSLGSGLCGLNRHLDSR
jgi:hypothetical protein